MSTHASSTKIDQKEYLKKYLSGDKVKKKKKDKKSKTAANIKVKIIDDDISSANNGHDIDEELLLGGDDAPQIVGEYTLDDCTNGGAVANKWRNIAVKEENEDENIVNIKQEVLEEELWGRKASVRKVKDEFSPTRKKTPQLTPNILPPRRNKEDRDNSPPRRQRKDSDNSPPRRRRDAGKNSTHCLLSPPRSRRRSSDQSPPRRSRKSPTRSRRKSSSTDQSPVRKKRNSPMRRKQHRSRSRDNSPSRRRQKSRDVDQSPPMRRQHSYQSPVRIKREKGTPDNSPTRKHIKRDSASPPPARRSRWAKAVSTSPPPTHKPAIKKTLDGKKAGLQDAHSLQRETDDRRHREDRLFAKMSSDISGRDAEVQVRSTGRRGQRARDAQAEDPEVQRRKEAHEQKKQQLYDRWGKGLKQVEAHRERIAELAYEGSKPLARYSNDEDLDRHLRQQERADDPMLSYMRQKNQERQQQSRVPTIPKYQGSYPENRFSIRPGYRWDGVDRSNGYEKKWFDVQNEKRAMQEDAYKYSVEDM